MMRNGNGVLNLKGIQNPRFVTVPGNSCSRRRVRFPANFTVAALPELNDYVVLGLTPFASKSDVKFAYKRLALKFHPDVIRGDHVAEKQETFREIKSAYESIMKKIEEEEAEANYEEFEEWEEWVGFEGGIPAAIYHSYNY